MNSKLDALRATMEHEALVAHTDPATGYRGIVAIHSTHLGPALGGTRFWAYADEHAAAVDALRLARGMTYKNALAGIPFGGGKSVIIGDNRTNARAELFRAHGRFVATFDGRYITAEDVGTSPADMEYVRQETRHVAGLADGSGDPSPVTAYGVFRAKQPSAYYRWGTDTLKGKTVALQGCGHVGYYLARELHRAGARLIATDTDEVRLRRVVAEFAARAVAPAEIYGVAADISGPWGLGGVINDETLPQLRVEIVNGAANNQLLASAHGAALAARGILYAPDFVANAGGVINGCTELLDWAPATARAKVHALYDTLLRVYEFAAAQQSTPAQAAELLAEQRLQAAESSHAHSRNPLLTG